MSLIKTHNSPTLGVAPCDAKIQCRFMEGNNDNQSHMLLSREEMNELAELTICRESGGAFGGGMTEEQKQREQDLRTRGVNAYNKKFYGIEPPKEASPLDNISQEDQQFYAKEYQKLVKQGLISEQANHSPQNLLDFHERWRGAQQKLEEQELDSQDYDLAQKVADYSVNKNQILSAQTVAALTKQLNETRYGSSATADLAEPAKKLGYAQKKAELAQKALNDHLSKRRPLLMGRAQYDRESERLSELHEQSKQELKNASDVCKEELNNAAHSVMRQIDFGPDDPALKKEWLDVEAFNADRRKLWKSGFSGGQKIPPMPKSFARDEFAAHDAWEVLTLNGAIPSGFKSWSK